MATLPIFGFGPGQNRQLGRLQSLSWGTKIDTPSGPQDTAVQPVVDELVQVLSSMMDRDDAVANYVNQVATLNATGLTTTVDFPKELSVSVVGCVVTISVASYRTLTYENGLLVGDSG